MTDKTDMLPGTVFAGGDDDVSFQYYMFDWDDNILHMPTKIYLEKKTEDGWQSHPVSTNQFALIRQDTLHYRPVNGSWDDAFAEFYDVGQRGERAFIEDTIAALEPMVSGSAPAGPSFRRFRKALVEGRLFAIITARAHSSANIRAAVQYFIDTVLDEGERTEMIVNLRSFNRYFGHDEASRSDEQILDQYLSLNKYRGVTSPEFMEAIGADVESGAESPARAKQLAIREFVNHVLALVGDRRSDRPISVGFSDDDAHNVGTVIRFIEEELAHEFPDIRFVVYDTSDPSIPRGKKIVIRGQLEFDLGHAPDDA
jgi:hypothetical protein